MTWTPDPAPSPVTEMRWEYDGPACAKPLRLLGKPLTCDRDRDHPGDCRWVPVDLEDGSWRRVSLTLPEDAAS